MMTKSVTRLSLCILLSFHAAAAFVSPVLTPPMAFNSWNLFGCNGINATILIDTAQAIVDTGLAAVGYEYVNSDDCWMLANRSVTGNQIANPEKFPNGFAAVTAAIHALGLKSGLYTAKAPHTCAGFAASCGNEYIDAQQWADWNVDYLKDDSCGVCPNRTDNEDYQIMFAAIVATGREMVLTVEGSPDNTICSVQGGCGNAKRVGHDISPQFMSMLSLVDIGSGLWPFAHNATQNATAGGWYNDLDMLEIGNSPDFNCSADSAALARCQIHFSMWCIMKAPLILGNDVKIADKLTLGVLGNREAIAINQDALGVQARRIRVQEPTISIPTTSLPGGAFAVFAHCNTSRPTQAWTISQPAAVTRSFLYLVKCNVSDVWQQWTFQAGGGLLNVGSGECVDSSISVDPGAVSNCVSGKASQAWTYDIASGHIATPSHACLDVYNNQGPDVEIGSCKVPGAGDSNQAWDYNNGVLATRLAVRSGMCLSVEKGQGGYIIGTTDAAGEGWMLGGSESSFPLSVTSGTPINASKTQIRYTFSGDVSAGLQNYSIIDGRGDSVIASSQEGGSGPWPHSAYARSTLSSDSKVTIDLNAAINDGASVPLQWSDTLNLIDDDLVGGVTVGGKFCLDVVTAGMLETWGGILEGGKFAAALLNRSPGKDFISVTSQDAGWSQGTKFAVRDIWEGVDKGTFTDTYQCEVEGSSVALLVLTKV